MRQLDRRWKRPFILALLLVVLASGATVAYFRVFVFSGRASTQIGTARTSQATTSTGRQGAYYLPRDYESRAFPLLVILHGTGSKGSLMILRLSELAEREGFIAVAPDSVNVAGVWVVRQRPNDVAEDYRHVMGCVREVLALPGVRIDLAHVLIAGFSVGGSAAPFIASHEDLFTAFAVLHGHVVLDGMGPRRVRGWLSTGDRDRLRTVEYIRSAADHMMRREGFSEVEIRVFRVDHTLQETELNALVAWWLHR
jgi:poly(3-hydroxybutyrate) depolymerase